MSFIKNLSQQELEDKLISFGEKPYRSKQIFQWLYQNMVSSFDEMLNIPIKLRNKLKENLKINNTDIIKSNISGIDNTTKYLFKLNDGELIESVFIPHSGRRSRRERNTLCLSTQVGCKFRCRFCASGLFGFKRNLSTGEIIDQIIQVKKLQKKKITNIVFMGIGEPFDNYENLLKAIRIINSPDALNIGSRKITISTCGIIPSIKKLADENIQVELSVSLHSTQDKTRNSLMPVNKKYPLDKLIEELRDYQQKTNRQITFEYMLIKNINDTDDELNGLVNLSKIMDCKINLFCFNNVNETKLKQPDHSDLISFQNKLKNAGVKTTLRTSRGSDINAACGQLRLRTII